MASIGSSYPDKELRKLADGGVVLFMTKYDENGKRLKSRYCMYKKYIDGGVFSLSLNYNDYPMGKRITSRRQMIDELLNHLMVNGEPYLVPSEIVEFMKAEKSK